MKKFIILIVFIPVLLKANPIAIYPYMTISEIYFGDTISWILEIDNTIAYDYDEVDDSLIAISPLKYIDSLILECNAGKAKIVEFDTTDYIIITNNSLNNSISLNKNTDYIKLYSYSSGVYIMDSLCIGNETNSYLKNIKNGQSISRLSNYEPYYKDNSPTIGFANDLDGATGKICGYFYDTDGELIINKYFYIDEGYCTPILQEQGYAGNLKIDENGFYCAEITSRSYSISEREIYESSTNHESLQFQTVTFDLNENDSLNINFTQILTSIESLNQNDFLLSSYPNPATDYIYFITSNTNKLDRSLKITVYNSVGKLIDSFNIASEQYQWNCNNLKQGTYIYTLSSENKIVGANKFQIVK